jgi:hypothetical protein
MEKPKRRYSTVLINETFKIPKYKEKTLKEILQHLVTVETIKADCI